MRSKNLKLKIVKSFANTLNICNKKKLYQPITQSFALMTLLSSTIHSIYIFLFIFSLSITEDQSFDLTSLSHTIFKQYFCLFLSTFPTHTCEIVLERTISVREVSRPHLRLRKRPRTLDSFKPPEAIMFHIAIFYVPALVPISERAVSYNINGRGPFDIRP